MLSVQKMYIESRHEAMYTDLIATEVLLHPLSIFDHKEKKSVLEPNDLDKVICSIIEPHIAEVFGEPNTIKVVPRNGGSANNVFTIFYNGQELMQFNVYKKYYGMKDHTTKEKLEDSYKQLKDDYEHELAIHNKEYEKYILIKNNPYRYINSFKYYKKSKYSKTKSKIIDYYVLTFKRKELFKAINKQLHRIEVALNNLENRYERTNNYEKDLEKLQIFNTVLAKIEPIFIECGYRLETDKRKLY